MSKFKHGDKVVCVQESMARGVVLGGRYTINNPNYNQHECFDTRVELLELPDASPYESCFELSIQDEPVAEYAVLSTKEVTEYFLNGRENELEYLATSGAWTESFCSMSFSSIKRLVFRVKPKVETIDYYGTALPKPLVLDDLQDTDIVYAVQMLGSGSVLEGTGRFSKTHPEHLLTYRTREEAQLVFDTMYKPFL